MTSSAKAVRQKSRVVAQAFDELDTREDTSAPVSHMEFFRLVTAKAARDTFRLHQLDIQTAFFQARMNSDDPDVSGGVECSECQTNQIWIQRVAIWTTELSARLVGNNTRKLIIPRIRVEHR